MIKIILKRLFKLLFSSLNRVSFKIPKIKLYIPQFILLKNKIQFLTIQKQKENNYKKRLYFNKIIPQLSFSRIRRNRSLS